MLRVIESVFEASITSCQNPCGISLMFDIPD